MAGVRAVYALSFPTARLVVGGGGTAENTVRSFRPLSGALGDVGHADDMGYLDHVITSYTDAVENAEDRACIRHAREGDVESPQNPQLDRALRRWGGSGDLSDEYHGG